jgi:hypothetical protein
MIAAGEKRVVIEALDDLDASSLFGSVLEKKFVDRLEAAGHRQRRRMAEDFGEGEIWIPISVRKGYPILGSPTPTEAGRRSRCHDRVSTGRLDDLG